MEVDVEEADDNISSRTRSQDNLGDIASRTRSKAAVNTTITKADQPVRFLEVVPRHLNMSTPALTLFQVFNYMNSPKFLDPVMPEITEDIGHKEQEQYQEAMSDAKKDKFQQLRYIQALDKEEDAQGLDVEGMVDMWDCKKVIAHKQTRKKGKTYIEVKCIWNDANRSTSWADMNAVALVDPTPISLYAKKKHTMVHGIFRLLCRGGT